jgi:hypothetical protein
LVEEGLVAAHLEPDLLWEGGSNDVVCGLGEDEEDDHLAHREDDASSV